MPARSSSWSSSRTAVLAACLLSITASLASTAVQSAEQDKLKITLPKQRLDAPGFSLPLLDKSLASLEQYRGKVVFVHFWATFCLPCLEELPALQTLWQEYQDDGLVILGIAADRGSTDVVREFAIKMGITFPVLHDRAGTVRNNYKVLALPTSYVIGRDGKISGRAIGSREWTTPQARKYIESLL